MATVNGHCTINNLPSEVLDYLFSYLLTLRDKLAVLHVCREWRAVRAAPVLWREIEIGYRLAHLFAAQFPRMRVRVSLDGWDRSVDKDELSAGWAKVGQIATAISMTEHRRQLSPAHATLLVYLCGPHVRAVSASQWFVDLAAARLKNVEDLCIFLERPPSSLGDRYSLDGLDLSLILRVIASLTNLKKLSLRGGLRYNPNIDRGARKSLPIETLLLSSGDRGAVAELISRCPNLCHVQGEAMSETQLFGVTGPPLKLEKLGLDLRALQLDCIYPNLTDLTAFKASYVAAVEGFVRRAPILRRVTILGAHFEGSLEKYTEILPATVEYVHLAGSNDSLMRSATETLQQCAERLMKGIVPFPLVFDWKKTDEAPHCSTMPVRWGEWHGSLFAHFREGTGRLGLRLEMNREPGFIGP